MPKLSSLAQRQEYEDAALALIRAVGAVCDEYEGDLVDRLWPALSRFTDLFMITDIVGSDHEF
jgi:hypothetical protein